jgi:hypothetical protein
MSVGQTIFGQMTGRLRKLCADFVGDDNRRCRRNFPSVSRLPSFPLSNKTFQKFWENFYFTRLAALIFWGILHFAHLAASIFWMNFYYYDLAALKIWANYISPIKEC